MRRCARLAVAGNILYLYIVMNFIAKVEDSQRSNIQEIARSLEKMGIQVRQVLKIPGVITGSSASLTLRQLKIKGIRTVERDRKLRAS